MGELEGALQLFLRAGGFARRVARGVRFLLHGVIPFSHQMLDA
jgi:hypothetical protein